MKYSFLIIVFSSIFLASCSGGSSDQSSEASSAQSFSKAKAEEITEIKEALKETAYSLSRSELDDLKADGAISEEDYQELLALTNTTTSTEIN